ncbi:MAG: alpha/beta fold hydrolase [Synechococcales bacterium]|nr:alpha/beta fold hydrolase [Synechococcales bacterium]
MTKPCLSPSLSSPQANVHGLASGKAGSWRSLPLPLVKLRAMAGIIGGLVIGLGSGGAAIAAERLNVRLGPVEQSVAIADLAYFAETGEVRNSLTPYTPFLTGEVRMALSTQVPLDTEVGDTLIQDLLHSSSGQQLLDVLELTIPDSTPDQLQATLQQVVQDSGSISFIGFLQAYPDTDLNINAAAALALASQLNLPYWQSHAVNSLLEKELTVEAVPFQAAFDPTLPGYERVRQQTLTFRDRTRDRTIPVDLYWSRWSRGPLVVISHGFGADRRFFSYLAYHLASNGLTVAALEHPGSNVAWLTGITLGEGGGGTLSEILPSTEFIERPRDISFLLDELQRLNRYSSVLRDQIDTDQVTVIGHSLGGYTALALAGGILDLKALREFCKGRSLVGLAPADWLQCSAVDLPDQPMSFRDPRVTQAIAFNPVMGRIFGDKGLSAIAIPTLIAASSEDTITPAVGQQFLPFSTLTTPTRYLLTVIGGTHLSMGDPANLNQALTRSMFLRERRRDETDSLRRMLKGVSLAFIKQQTPEAELYAPFLTPTYVQSWSTDRVKTRISSDLSPNLEKWLKMAAVPFDQVVAATVPKQRQQPEETFYTASIRFLTKSLPFVMFIPPASASLVGIEFFRKLRRQRQIDDQDWG